MVVVASNWQQGSCRFSPHHLDSRGGMTDQQGAPRASVLIVDDDPDLCEVLTDLVRYEGYDAEHAWSGTDALAKIQKAAFSAVILNVHLPDQDGRVVLLDRRERYPSCRSSCSPACGCAEARAPFWRLCLYRQTLHQD